MLLSPFTSIKNKLTNLEYIKFKVLVTVLLIGYLRSFYFLVIYFQIKEISHIIIFVLGFSTVNAFLLYIFKHPKKISLVLHLGILITFIGMLYRIYAVEDFLITQIQTTFLITIWSFCGLGKRWGIIYSLLYSFVFPLHILVNGYEFIMFPGEYDYNYYFTWVIFAFNTVVIVYVPFLYQDAIRSVLQRKTYLNKSLNESIEANKDFTSTITHELRTPLNTVIGITNLLIEKNTTQEEKKDLEKLQIESDYLLELITKILEYNKLNLNLIKDESSALDLHAIIENFFQKNQQKISSRSIHFKKKISPTLTDKLIITDATRISIAINNLLDYFIKISPTDSTILLNINTKVDKHLDQLLFIFSIENKSITFNNFSTYQFFEPFTKLNPSKNENIGLELSIAKKAIDYLGHPIEVFNSLKTGIRVQFYLPVTLEDNSSPLIKNYTEKKSIELSKLNILTVDDNSINLLFMKSLLSHWGINSNGVLNGYEAIEIVKKQKVDIMLMDLHMPEISGFETSKKIRDLENTISQPYIIAVSAVNKEDIESNISQSGINDFIPKPFDHEDLKNTLIKYYHMLYTY